MVAENRNLAVVSRKTVQEKQIRDLQEENQFLQNENLLLREQAKRDEKKIQRLRKRVLDERRAHMVTRDIYALYGMFCAAITFCAVLAGIVH